jgi:hypothetical protein
LITFKGKKAETTLKNSKRKRVRVNFFISTTRFVVFTNTLMWNFKSNAKDSAV